MEWEEVYEIIVDVLQPSGVTIFVYASGQEIRVIYQKSLNKLGQIYSKYAKKKRN